MRQHAIVRALCDDQRAVRLEQVRSGGNRSTVAGLTLATLMVAGTVAWISIGSSDHPKPVSPAATTIACGDVIMHDIVVANDPPSSCSGDGLVVGANNVSINMAGHTLTGSAGGYGINAFGRLGFTVTNGNIRGFSFGLIVSEPNATVTRMRVSAAGVYGIYVSRSERALVSGNVVFDTGSSGMFLEGDRLRATGNVVRQSGGAGMVIGGDHVSISGNRTVNNATYGIYLTTTRAAVTGNASDQNGNSGLATANDPAAMVRSNRANYNGSLGIDAASSVTDDGGNTAKGNTTAHQCKNVLCT